MDSLQSVKQRFGIIGNNKDLNRAIEKSIRVASSEDVYYTSHNSKINDIAFKLEALKREAPIAKGEHIANLHVEGTLKSNFSIPLYAQEDVETAGFFSRIYSKFKGFFFTQKKAEYKEMMEGITASLLKKEGQSNKATF